MLSARLHTTPWTSGGRSRPSRCCGRSQATPSGPRVRISLSDKIGFGKARQQQRVGPHQDAGDHARECTARGAVAPDQPAEEGRRKLRDRGKRQEADRGKLRLAGEAIIEIGEEQDQEDREPPHGQQHRADIAAAREDRGAPLQHERHHDVVRRHDGERDGLDDHHRGRGGQPADEGDERQQLGARCTAAARARTCRCRRCRAGR